MRNFWSIIITLFILASCSESDPYSLAVFTLNNPIQIRVDRPFGVKVSANDTITTNILSINDSRCPGDVVCIRAGEYSTDLELILSPDTAYVYLCNGDCNNSKLDSARFTLRNSDYWIRLDDLTPYPLTSNPNPEYTLHFTIFEAD